MDKESLVSAVVDGPHDPPRVAPGSESGFLSRREVARLFGVSLSTVTRWALTGLIATIRTPGGHYRYRAEDVRQAARSEGGVDEGDLTRRLS